MLSQKNLFQVIERINYGILICDKNGKFELWNKKAQDLLAINEEILYRDVWTEYFQMYKLDGTEIDVEHYPLIKALKGIRTLNEVIMVKNITNDVIISIDSFPLENQENEIVGAVAVFSDVTQKVKMEQLFEDLLVRFDHIKLLLESSIKKN